MRRRKNIVLLIEYNEISHVCVACCLNFTFYEDETGYMLIGLVIEIMVSLGMTLCCEFSSL